LLKLLTSINLHLLWPVVQLVTLRKTLTTWVTTKAHDRPKVLRQLSKSIWGQLVELHSKLNQDISEDRLRGHPEPSFKKFFKHNGFIICWLQNNFFPWLTRRTLDKIP
jgi:hypothetical protein